MGSGGVAVKAVDRIAHAFGQIDQDAKQSAYVVRFAAADPDNVAPDPMVVVSECSDDAAETALTLLARGFPFFRPGDDPLVYWLNASATLRTLLWVETARANGAATEQLRRLKRARAIDQRLMALDRAFEGPELTKKSHAQLSRGQLSGLAYKPERAPIEQIEFAYTECGRPAALLVDGAPYQPIDVVGLTLEFTTLLREAQLYEARLLNPGGLNRSDGPSREHGGSDKADRQIPRDEPAAATRANGCDDFLYVSTKEAACRLRLSANFLAQLRVRGGGPPYSKIGRAVRYQIRDINDWARARAQSSTSDIRYAC